MTAISFIAGQAGVTMACTSRSSDADWLTVARLMVPIDVDATLRALHCKYPQSILLSFSSEFAAAWLQGDDLYAACMTAMAELLLFFFFNDSENN